MRFVTIYLTLTFTGLLFSSVACFGQETKAESGLLNNRPVIKDAVIERRDGAATITVNNLRPLFKVIEALRDNYGWHIDYEDGRYISELLNTSNPKFKAAFPGERIKENVLVPMGGFFQARYIEDANLLPNPDEQARILEKIVAEYNRSDNPGKFAVRREGEDRFAVVCISVKDENQADKLLPSVLDTPVSIPAEARHPGRTLDLILEQVRAKIGLKLMRFAFNENHGMKSSVIISGENVSARILIERALPLHNYSLMYGTFDGGTLVLNIRRSGRT